MSRLARSQDVALLGAAAEKLLKLAEGPGWGGDQLVWTIGLGAVRAYVWARYTGGDVVRALAERHFGRGRYEQLGPGAKAMARAQAARLDGFGVAIPRRSSLTVGRPA